MSSGEVVIGSYAPYPTTQHGDVVVGTYEPYPTTQHGMVVIGVLGTPPSPSNLYLQTVLFVGADTSGDVQIINAGKDDNATPIYYELETQEIEFGNRSHLKQISDSVQVLVRCGAESAIMGKVDDGDYQPIRGTLNRRVNILDIPSMKGHFFKFKWSGVSSLNSPILDGFALENVTDFGLTHG